MSTDPLWPCRPKLQPNELLSSWVFRTAHAHGMEPLAFCRAVWPGRKVAVVDMDNLGAADVVATMARQTNTPLDVARSTTLGALSGFLFERHLPKNRTRWIITTDIEGGIWHHPGLQFCPHCLGEGLPYYRRTWRLALAAVCPEHGVVLADRCGGCGAYVMAHKTEVAGACHQCGAALADTPCLPAPSAALSFHRRNLAILRRGWTFLGEHYLYSTRYFDILHHVLTLLGLSKRSAFLREFVARQWGGDPAAVEFAAGYREVENLTSLSRARLLDLAARLMEGWPFRFVGACGEAGIWHGKAMWHFRDAPFAYADSMRAYLYNAAYRPSCGEAEAAAAHLRTRGQIVTTRALGALVGNTKYASALIDFPRLPSLMPPAEAE